MPYIPERRFEDKPDIFTPFVPLDHDNVVQVCETNEDHQGSKMPKPKPYLMYSLIALVLLYSLKQYKR